MKNWELKDTDQLEKESDWNAARDKLYHNWKENPQDLKVFLKLSFLCWYLVVEWGVENTSKVQESDYDDYEELLQELYHYGILHFKEDAFFNAVFGFMIELFPEYFGEDYDKTKEFGDSLINKSFNLNKEDPFIELIYLSGRTPSRNPAYSNAVEKHFTTVKNMLKGTGVFQEYFSYMLLPNGNQL